MRDAPSTRARRCAALAAFAVLLAACPGRPPGPPTSGACPPEMALVDARFCVDRWEASLVAITAAGEQPHSPFEVVAGRRVRAVAREGAIPQGYVSAREAAGACREAGKRLCREDEWVAACKAGGRGPFPYGAERRPGYCNDEAEGRSPLRALFEGKGVDMYQDGPMNDPRLNQLPHTLARTGSHARCAGALGVFDMVGNLHEWVDDPAGTFRGGYYLDTRLNGPGCEYRTTAHHAGYHDYSTGFRCCRDAR